MGERELALCGTKGLFIDFGFLSNSSSCLLKCAWLVISIIVGKKIGNIDLQVDDTTFSCIIIIILSVTLSCILIISTASPLRPHHHLNIFFNFKKKDNNNLSICLVGICIKRFSFFTARSNSNYVDVPPPSRPNKGCVHEQACISKFLKQPAIIGPSTRSCAVPRRRSHSWRSQ